MKKLILTAFVGLCTLSLTTGCGQMMGNESPTALGEAETDVRYHHSQTEKINREDVDRTKFGYVRHHEAQVRQQNRNPRVAYYDRALLADAISEMAVYLPEVEEAGTLVSDKYVLIAYTTDSEDREAVANQVRLTAESIIPRFYDVYVADNPRMFNDIQRFGSLSTSSPDVDEIMSLTIEEMRSYPQGHGQAQQYDNETNLRNDDTNMR
ncbi:YhcN/YlaJ family sporulation lipoprotein [Bacillus sp. FJAT-45350]|uniref:YhcN/YlaJ family sporulation lipoprotein n=1 Tax=Bacillus sp. FJAT-45350 TaxID=2011014 RepID=UPI000BB729C4|nr:YhcN/YlaJ family sporulation lipoprotein [Bacillus sp. FJAT-45350]